MTNPLRSVEGRWIDQNQWVRQEYPGRWIALFERNGEVTVADTSEYLTDVLAYCDEHGIDHPLYAFVPAAPIQ